MTHTSHRLARTSRFTRLTLALACIALVAASTPFVVAKPTQPNANDRQITFAVATLMERDHLTGQRIDDTISKRTLKSFIKDLDPLKLFFLQSDIDDFNRSQNNLDDQIKHG